MTLNETSWHGNFELARALIGLKRGPEAEASALRARELKPDNPQVLLLANAHMQERNYTAVLQDFDAYLKLEPDPAAREGIHQRRQRLEKALENAQAASPAH